MNYILNLQEQVQDLRQELAQVREQVQELRVYLSLPKFQGVGNDHVNVKDVFARLQGI